MYVLHFLKLTNIIHLDCYFLFHYLCKVKKIGIISDTHSFIDDKINDFFKDTDIIFHAGDIGSSDILKTLRQISKTIAVYGNIDDTLIRQIAKEYEIIKIEGVNILMTHIGGYPGRYQPTFFKKIMQEKPNLVITGHSHILKVIFDKKLNHLHINPGAYGKNGFHKARTAIRLVIDGKNIKDLEVFESIR